MRNGMGWERKRPTVWQRIVLLIVIFYVWGRAAHPRVSRYMALRLRCAVEVHHVVRSRVWDNFRVF